MTQGNDDQLDSILDAWQQAFEAGRDVTAAELCRERPDLLPEVERKIALLRRMTGLHRERNSDQTATADHAATASASDPDATTGPPDGRSGANQEGGNSGAPPGYELLGELGRGGMGVVYRARQVKLNREVALKTVLSAGASRVAVARFWAEAEVMAAVRHEHVVQVYELGEFDGKPFMALEYVPGGSLADRLNSGALAPRESAVLLEKVSRGVAAAHELGIVHRDLKPANVLLATDGAPKVTDFGLAKGRSVDLTQTQALMGTPAYMAPEQAAGRAKFVGPQADVWALGVILYECLTGKRPFQGDTVEALLSQIRSTEPRALRTVVTGVPRDLETIVSKCLAKEPEHRYPTAAELADDLDRFRGGKPILARPTGRAEQAWRWCRRNPAVAALLAAVVLVFAAGAGVASYFAIEEGKRAKEADENARAAADRERDANTERDRVREEQGRTRAARDRALRLLHVSRVNAAQAALNEGQVRRAIALLDEMRPGPGEEDLRGWEWHYLWRLTHRETWTHELAPAPEADNVHVWVNWGGGRVVLQTNGRAARVDFAWGAGGGPAPPAPGRSVSVVDTGTRAVVWRATGERLGDRVLGRGMSADGRYLALHTQAGKMARLRLFDTRDDRELPLPEPDAPYLLATLLVGPNGDWVAACPVDTPLDAPGFGAAGTGGKKAEADRPLVIVWDRARGVVRRIPRTPQPGSSDAPTEARLFPDGRSAIVVFAAPGGRFGRPTPAPPDRRPPEVWNVADPPVRRFALPSGTSADVTWTDVSEDGRRMVVAAAGSWLVLDAVTGAVESGFLHPVRDRRDRPYDRRRVSNDGHTVILHATGSGELVVGRRAGGARGEWTVSTIHMADRLWLDGVLTGDGQRLYVVTEDDERPVTLRAWDLPQATDYPWSVPDGSRPAEAPKSAFPPVGALSPDGRLVAIRPIPEDIGDVPDEVTLLDAETGRPKGRLRLKTDGTEMALLSPDFRRAVTTGRPLPPKQPPAGRPNWQREYPWWSLADAETGRELARHDGSFTDRIEFSPDGRYLLTPAPVRPGDPPAEGSRQVRDAGTGAVVAVIPTRATLFDSAGGYVVASWPRRKAQGRFGTSPVGVTLYDLPGGRERWSLRAPPDGREIMYPAAVSSDGLRIAILAGIADEQSRMTGGSVRVLDAATGGEQARFPVGPFSFTGPSSDESRVSFSPDGRRLVVLEGRDAVVWTLDGESPAPLRLRGHEEWIVWCAFEPGGRLFTMAEEAELGRGWAAQGPVKVWDLGTGSELLSLPVPAGIPNRAGSGFPIAQLLYSRTRLVGGKLVMLLANGPRVYDGTPVND